VSAEAIGESAVYGDGIAAALDRDSPFSTFHGTWSVDDQSLSRIGVRIRRGTFSQNQASWMSAKYGFFVS